MSTRGHSGSAEGTDQTKGRRAEERAPHDGSIIIIVILVPAGRRVLPSVSDLARPPAAQPLTRPGWSRDVNGAVKGSIMSGQTGQDAKFFQRGKIQVRDP